MGVRLERQSFGDYVATIDGTDSVSSSSPHVEIKCYSWPSPGSRVISSLWPCLSPVSPPSAASDRTAYCWCWRLSTHLDDRGGEAVMSANLTISRSHLTLAADTRGGLGPECDPSLAVDWETKPLSAKMARVHHWEPIYALNLRYRRLEA